MSENKYMNGKIYMIGSKHTDKIYIGSTTKPVNERLIKHESDFKKYKDGKFNYVASYQILELGHYYILLIENVKVETKKELEMIEGNYVRKFKDKCVNRRIEGRTKKEYRKDTKEHKKIVDKKYYEENKEMINKRLCEKINCECGKTYTYGNKLRHFKSTRHQQYEQNKTINI